MKQIQHGDDVGQIQLGSEDVEAAAVAGDVMVDFNVLTARKSGPDNLISCDFIDGKLATVTPAPVALHCALIEVRYDTKHKP
ncbi:hypothetical protein [Marilutibacter alkalisoli]|uniref:Uncharacterized protein n=1 Tax=Marilutibacter alkalisoli TaxID=2591633 RepID=A0A514BVZ2_9GAMM|nr:hypothetical protein [Lysobacter alkalisoli]QDH71512.1 hypothetical protein FKV23_16490 [Lysobacter alkalisoli]